ncbi:MAG TPA: hypothetical protein VK471_03135 [Solirubrobacterales bacterium]|nr:hypothetical protein [Solirubrobacterales bacterium]
MATTPTTSTRFRRAAETERDRLARQREKIAARAKGIREELGGLESQMHELDERINSLRGLIGDHGPQGFERPVAVPASSGQALGGSAIRMAAVRVLMESGRGDAPIHYRNWLELLRDAGYDVAGKRPDAVFLSQVARSPVVKATTKAGVYELDLGAPERLTQRLEALQRELSDLAASAPSGGAELRERTVHQEEISLEIRRTQKALTEATDSLGEAFVRQSAKLAA